MDRRPKQEGFRRPPCRLQREGGALCATTGILGLASLRGGLPQSRRARLPVYRGVRPNNNNNNHAALAELFQTSTLHEVQQLGLYTNTDTPDTAHQLDAEAVAIKVVYTMTNTRLSCSGGEELGRIQNTSKYVTGLPQAARWKAAWTMKQAVFYSNMMLELGYNESFGSVRCTSTTRRRCMSSATAPIVLAESTSR